MRLRLSAKPSTAERRQTLCAVQTLSGFPQRSFPAHKRAILRTSHTKLPFFDKQSRARMRWARLKFRLCRGDAVHAYACRSPTQRAAVHHTALPWARLWGTSRMRWFSLPRNPAGPDYAVPKRILRPPECPARPAAASGPAFRFQKFFKGVACIAGNLVTIGLQQLCQFSKRLRLAERLAAGKGDAAHQRIFLHTPEQVLHCHIRARAERPAFRVVAALAPARAALRKNSCAQARARLQWNPP